MNIGTKINILRKSKNLTQIELAKIIGVEKSTINKYESNQRLPELKILIKIADYFDVSLDYLVGRTSQSKKIKK